MHTNATLKKRVAFINLDETDRRLMREFMPVLEKELPGILDKFYAQIAKFPEIAQFFSDKTRINRASTAQSQHWLRLFSGRFDDDYYASVKAIGLMHSRIGLDPSWYMGGYSFILGHLCTLVGQRAGRGFNGASRAARLISAVNKAVMLDAELAVSVYIDENKASYDVRLEGLVGRFEERVSALVNELSAGSQALEEAALSMNDTVGDTNQRAMAVAAASEQASASIQTVSSSAEQLRASIGQIRGQVDESALNSQDAVTTARRTDDIVRTLAQGAEEIGAVIGLISQIANKTNMLALNASVEAARAGSAGKAFEVVAKEVKELAYQTGRATDQISQQIGQVQRSSREAVDAIGQITTTIDHLSRIAGNLAAAVREQDVATSDISQNVQQTAIAANEVSTNIVTVSSIADIAGIAANSVLESARGVSDQTKSLSAEMDDFLRSLRAA